MSSRILVTITRADLVSRRACGGGLALFDAIAEGQRRTPATADTALRRRAVERHGAHVRIVWTQFAALLIARDHPGFTSWLWVAQLLPRISFRGADLRVADLGGADLRGADLRGADLGGAKVDGIPLVGTRPVLQLGPLGSRSDYLLAFLTEQGIRIRAGCFSGTLAEFAEAVEREHGDSEHGREYAAAIAMIETHAAIWAPAAEPAKATA